MIRFITYVHTYVIHNNVIGFIEIRNRQNRINRVSQVSLHIIESAQCARLNTP